MSLARTVVVGVLNATPDSFSGGGRVLTPRRAAHAAAEMVDAGAGMLDLGAESTRPGATPVSAADELARLLPMLRAVRRAVAVPLSVDTMKADVARAALDAGADLVNDVTAGRFDRGMLPLCARAGVPIVLMHMRGTPRTMQRQARYRDVTVAVIEFLRLRVRAAVAAGIAPAQIVLDPGLGFAKLARHSYALLRELPRLVALGHPVLVGASRKRFIGQALDDAPVGDRLFGTAAAVALAVQGGARLVRVHDVAAMRDVVRVTEAVLAA